VYPDPQAPVTSTTDATANRRSAINPQSALLNPQ
jgi:hypothetical protein